MIIMEIRMNAIWNRSLAAATTLLAMACSTAAVGALPEPAVDAPKAATSSQATAVFAGGCFWGVEAVFKHVKGVSTATSGYAGGSAATAKYTLVGSGMTGHAESVEVKYDPSQVTYGQLLRVFFAVAHDPTQLNRQGPDWGSQYRSAIFFTSPDQERVAKAYIAQLDAAKTFPKPIVTEVAPLKAFFAAEDYHQNYLALHPDQPYIVINDLPKLAALKSDLPELYVKK
jgi:peptide-methionine (S)-S-oxide reductase